MAKAKKITGKKVTGAKGAPKGGKGGQTGKKPTSKPLATPKRSKAAPPLPAKPKPAGKTVGKTSGTPKAKPVSTGLPGALNGPLEEGKKAPPTGKRPAGRPKGSVRPPTKPIPGWDPPLTPDGKPGIGPGSLNAPPSPPKAPGGPQSLPRKGGKGGRPRIRSKADTDRLKRDIENLRIKEADKSARDIAPLPTDQIDWDRRKACEQDLKLFAETYLPSVFYYGWSTDQLRCVRKMETVTFDGGSFALAMPRGGGKTAICRATILWATAYAHRRFPFFIGPSQGKTIQTLDFIKTYWYRSHELRTDFPEIGYPVYRLEGRFHLAAGQIYRGERTYIEWGSEAIRYPCLLLPETEIAPYLVHCPGMVRQTLISSPEGDPRTLYYLKSAGVMVSTAGIDGSIRGEAEIHPITLEQPRPDLVLLDDIQKDAKADSPASCEKLITLIDGAIQGLAGPGETIASIMPCTVIRKDDVSDTYLDRQKKPEWKGERCSLVNSWPPGITDDVITTETEEGKAWMEYAELRKKSLRLFDDLRLATDFYRDHRALMDNGFEVSWAERYNTKTELSAQQHAMNLRLTAPMTFPAEYQNRPKSALDTSLIPITPAQVAERTIAVPRYQVPVDHDILVSFIDVQDEILFYTTLAVTRSFTGLVIDYGTFPETHSRYITKNQSQGWKLLTKLFYQQYPHKADGKAPLEAKIYHAMTLGVNYLRAKVYVKQDGRGTPMVIQKLGIDTRWGQVQDTIKRYCRDSGIAELMPYLGLSVPPTQKQFEEYSRTKGHIFEDNVNPWCKEVKWIWRPDGDGQYRLAVDTSRVKTFLMNRLSCPQGSDGAITLFDAPPEQHDMFAQHVAGSEYPEEIQARGIRKFVWKARQGGGDNDYLDTLVGCTALASFCGAMVRIEGETISPLPRRRKLSDLWAAKRNQQ